MTGRRGGRTPTMKRAQGKFLDSLERLKVKSQRKRWKANDQVYEEDPQHGELEKYNRRGKHLGSIDPESGEIIKGPVKGRSIEI